MGIIALEETAGFSGLSQMSLHLNRPLHLPGVRDEFSKDELEKAYDATAANGRTYFYDHFGTMDSALLYNKIRYLARHCGCKWIIFDHISIMVSGSDGDERRALDIACTQLKMLAMELNIGMHMVCHLNRPQGTAHEDGARTTMSQLRGTAGIGQIANIVVGLERDQQSTEHKDVITVRVLKNRYSGHTGIAGYMQYDHDTNRITEISNPFPEEGKYPFKDETGSKGSAKSDGF